MNTRQGETLADMGALNEALKSFTLRYWHTKQLTNATKTQKVAMVNACSREPLTSGKADTKPNNVRQIRPKMEKKHTYKRPRHYCIANQEGWIALAFSTERRARQSLSPRMKGFFVAWVERPIPHNCSLQWAKLTPYNICQHLGDYRVLTPNQ